MLSFAISICAAVVLYTIVVIAASHFYVSTYLLYDFLQWQWHFYPLMLIQA